MTRRTSLIPPDGSPMGEVTLPYSVVVARVGARHVRA